MRNDLSGLTPVTADAYSQPSSAATQVPHPKLRMFAADMDELKAKAALTSTPCTGTLHQLPVRASQPGHGQQAGAASLCDAFPTLILASPVHKGRACMRGAQGRQGCAAQRCAASSDVRWARLQKP